MIGLSRAALFAVTLAVPAALAGSPLDQTQWRLADLAGHGVIDDAEATLAFAADGKISGKGSCNRFFGTAVLAGDRLSIGPLGATRMACAPAVDDQEQRYFAALGNAERFAIDGPRLRIYCKGLDQPLTFIRTAPP